MNMRQFRLFFVVSLCSICLGLSVMQGGLSSKLNLARNGVVGATAFHHVEFTCGDATTTCRQFMNSLGLEIAAKSDLSTGNTAFCSHLGKSDEVQFLFTAPSNAENPTAITSVQPFPHYSAKKANAHVTKHGLSVCAVAVTVDSVPMAFEYMVRNGGIPILPPTVVHDRDPARGWCDMAEVKLYGDVCLRLINTDNFKGNFLPNFQDVVSHGSKLGKYGIGRIDHVVGNVHSLQDTLKYIKTITGFHDFAEFTAEDVGTVDSGLNSAVLASENEMVLLPVNEPTFGTKRKSQIQTYLEQNQGEGVQHIALFTRDIFATLRRMQAATGSGGFEFMPGQAHDYYERVKVKLGPDAPFTEEQYATAEKMGILIDKDDQGILLQIFTKPIGDRPTIFFEIIQRVGCIDPVTGIQKAGCGGFGKGNFKDLFKSIENYESDLKIN